VKRNEQADAESRFPDDIAQHQMKVKRNDGLYRHIYFGRPGTGNMSFSITTWPGYLAYTGDMGDYVFCRLDDMFQFFRTDRTPNYSYWAEKVVAQDKADGVCVGRSTLRSYRWSYRYVWCCNALLWAIKQYDAEVAKQKEDAK
jgi:hypothetical protein